MSRIIAYTALLLCVSIQAMSQNACEVTLTRAQEEFDAGRFHGVPAMLEECIRQGQKREWEQRAYLLLAETYLLLEDASKADESFLKVLQANPEYETDETRDPIDLVYLSKKFTATPIFSLSAKVGLNTSFVRVIHDVRISSNETQSYSLNTGWQAGLGVEYHYRPDISVSGEAVYRLTAFTHHTKDLFNEGHYSVDFTDRQTWLSIPISIRYSHGEGILRPFALLGYSTDLLVGDRADFIIDGDNESGVFKYKYKKTKLNSSVVAALGVKYKWGLRYLFAEVRYSIGLSNLADPAVRFDKYEGVSQRGLYVDDDFRMDNLSISVGYVHPFYKARKLKKANTKSVLRKTKR